MKGRSTWRILCVGNDADVTESRAAVLSCNGYDVRHASSDRALEQLRTRRWDLVIIPKRLADEHPYLLAPVPPNLRVLVTQGFLIPSELLVAVARRLRMD